MRVCLNWILVDASEGHLSIRVMRQRVETYSCYRYVGDEDDDEELSENIGGLPVRGFAITSPRLIRIRNFATT